MTNKILGERLGWGEEVVSAQKNPFGPFPAGRRSRSLRCGGPKARREQGDRARAALTLVFSVPILATAAPPMVGGKKPKRPAWDLKGQLCDLNAELKCYRERKQVLDQENQQLQDQLRQAQQQASALGAERRTLEEELIRVRAQAEQGQRELGNLSARVLELEERLGTQEGLVQELQQEQLRLQEERRGLAAQLGEQEVRAGFSLGGPEVALGFEVLSASVQQHRPLPCSPPLCALLLCLASCPTSPHSDCFHNPPLCHLHLLYLSTSFLSVHLH